jgi:hypothetical protein
VRRQPATWIRLAAVLLEASFPHPCPPPNPTPGRARRGWQWLFMLEGIPSVLLGFIMFVMLPNNIETAAMLTPEEREALAAEVARDHLPGALEHDFRTMLSMLRTALFNKYMWPIFVAGLLMSIASAVFTLFTPIIIKNLLSGTAFSNATVQAAKGSKDLRPIALSIVPFATAFVLSYLVAHSSQRRNEQFIHNFICLLIAGVAMALFTPLAQASVAAGFIALSLSLAISFAAIGPGMVLVARLCRGREQPVAQPLSNTFNLFGGIIGPFITGALLKTEVRGGWAAGRLGSGVAGQRGGWAAGQPRGWAAGQRGAARQGGDEAGQPAGRGGLAAAGRG